MPSVFIFMFYCGFVDNVGPLEIQFEGLLREKKKKRRNRSFLFFHRSRQSEHLSE